MNENAQTKDIARPQTTTSKEQAHSEKLSDYKNVFESTKPFRYPETQSQPCMSFMPAVPGAVLRRTYPGATPIQAAHVHKMSDEDRAFFNSAIIQLRHDCRKQLEFLVKFDSGISHMGAQRLCDAINEIDQAVIPA